MNNYDNIPNELKNQHQWVIVRGGSKAPVMAHTLGYASSTNPFTWSKFELAYKIYNDKLCDYLGYVFNDNGYVGIDIDHAIGKDGKLNEAADSILARCQSYTEVSKSGSGLHIIVKGSLPFTGKNNLNGVEIYRASRFFVMTGNIFGFSDIEENQTVIDYVVNSYMNGAIERAEKPTNYIKSNNIYDWYWEEIGGGKLPLRPKYEPIGRGGRNNSLCSVAGQLHSIGYTKEQILNEVSRCNDLACTPPLSDKEIRHLVNSITRYRR